MCKTRGGELERVLSGSREGTKQIGSWLCPIRKVCKHSEVSSFVFLSKICWESDEVCCYSLGAFYPESLHRGSPYPNLLMMMKQKGGDFVNQGFV